MLMIRPYARPRINGTKDRHIKNAEVRFVSMTLRHSSSVRSTRDLRTLIPALFTNMSTRPKVELICFSRERTCASWLTSARKKRASVPPCAASAAVSFSFPSSRPTSASLTPSFARSSAIAFPSPRLPPVISATRCCNFSMTNSKTHELTSRLEPLGDVEDHRTYEPADQRNDQHRKHVSKDMGPVSSA